MAGLAPAAAWAGDPPPGPRVGELAAGTVRSDGAVVPTPGPDQLLRLSQAAAEELAVITFATKLSLARTGITMPSPTIYR